MALPHLQLGVSPLSWTNDVLLDLGDEFAVETCLQQAAAAGYQGIELGRKFPRTPEALAPLLETAGLQLAAGWYSGFLAERSLEEELAAVRDHALLLRRLGARVMVYGECGQMPGDAPLDQPLSRSPPLSAINLRAWADKLNAFADILLRDDELQLAFHPHLMMLVEREAELSAFLAATNANVGLVLDSGHACAAGIDLARMLALAGDRIRHIHLKDVRPAVLARVLADDLSFNQAVRLGLFTTPGDGCIDYAPLFQFLQRGAFQGWLIVEAEQDPALAPPQETVTRAARWLHQQLAFPPLKETV